MRPIETPDNITILLIEDNPGDVRLVQEMFSLLHHIKIKLIVAQTLEKGLKYLATELIHIILLDLNLPDCTGIATFRKINEFSLNTPIIILSILSDKELVYESLKEGAQDYLIKGHTEVKELALAIHFAMWNYHNVKENQFR